MTMAMCVCVCVSVCVCNISGKSLMPMLLKLAYVYVTPGFVFSYLIIHRFNNPPNLILIKL